MKYFFVCPDIRHVEIINELEVEADVLLSYIYIVPVYGKYEDKHGNIRSGMKCTQPTQKIIDGKVKNRLLSFLKQRCKRRKIT